MILDSQKNKGQILAELLIAIAILAVIAALGAQLIHVSLRATDASKETGRMLRMAGESMEAMRAIAYGNDTASQGWNRIYKPPDGNGDAAGSKGNDNPYYPRLSAATPAIWELAGGVETVLVDGASYTRRVIIENVSRDASGMIEEPYAPLGDDPATQKITVTVTRGEIGSEVILSSYLTRFFNESTPQSDWTGGTNCGPTSALGGSNDYCFQQCMRRLPGKIDLQPGC